jgi:hypothetical protein
MFVGVRLSQSVLRVGQRGFRLRYCGASLLDLLIKLRRIYFGHQLSSRYAIADIDIASLEVALGASVNDGFRDGRYVAGEEEIAAGRASSGERDIYLRQRGLLLLQSRGKLVLALPARQIADRQQYNQQHNNRNRNQGQPAAFSRRDWFDGHVRLLLKLDFGFFNDLLISHCILVESLFPFR